MNVGILGGGQWGQALGRLVKKAGHSPLIAYEGKRPPHVLPSTNKPPEVCEQCDLIFVATSANMTRQAIQKARPGPHNRIVVAGRGIEPATGKWMSNVVQEECDAIRVGALGGPAPVQEILNGGLCAGVVASPFEEVRRLATDALHSTRFRLYESNDLLGVQLTSAFVPVMACLLGLASNLRGAGVGMHAMVLARGMAEGGRLARAFEADEATLWGLAGIGDLISAQAKPTNPYFQAGKALAAGSVIDGPWHMVSAILERASHKEVELPLTLGLQHMSKGADPIDIVQQLMSRSATIEH
jgi:glycerol-3-phosphate dehydrogenase (NAD(P)+)